MKVVQPKLDYWLLNNVDLTWIGLLVTHIGRWKQCNLNFFFFFWQLFFFSIFGPCIEHGPTKIQTLLLDIDESWCHFVLIFSFFFRNYNPEGRKKPVSREEAMEELIDVVINLAELKSWVITLDCNFLFLPSFYQHRL